MGSVRLQSVTKQFGGQVVLHEVTLDLHTGQVAALIGANGVGKTTLFRLIAGQVPPDTGTVTVSRGLEVGYLPQEPDIAAGATLKQAVAEAFSELMAAEQKLQALAQQIAEEHEGPQLGELMRQYDRANARFETAGGYSFEQRLNEVLGGLGFSPADYELPVAALSGGQKCRAALAKLLLQGVGGGSSACADQFLLLDEPTNHLDIDAVRWLEKFLVGHHGGAVIISHDRYLLDRLAERTIEVVAEGSGSSSAGGMAAALGGHVRSYPGNYSHYVQTRELRDLSQQRRYVQDQAFIEKERAYIAKHMAGQRSRQAQGRQKRLLRQLDAGEFTVERPGAQRATRINFDATLGNKGNSPAGRARKPHTAKELLRVEGLHKQYGDKVLFTNLDLAVCTGERLGITGPNGTGKTTLFRVVLGQVAPEAGSVYVNPAARIGHFAQDSGELNPDRTVIEEIIAIRGDFLERDARHYAARFLFTGQEPFKRIGQLSGGEQSRVRFMKLILAGPDVLMLDEPTNHLDIPSREALEAALAEFPGTIIAISHDRYFLDRVADKLLVIRPGEHRLYEGNYSYYIEKVEQARAAAEAEAEATTRKPSKGGGKERRTSAKDAAPRSPLAKMKLPDLEAYITEREERLGKLHGRFGDPAVYKDPAAIRQLRAEFDTLKEELAAAEQVWLERADKA